jgi:DNA gyrase subunit A
VVLVTDGGQLIRCPVADIRIARRMTRGVKLFHLAEGERVVAVARLVDESGENGENGEAGGDLQGGPLDGATG